MKKGYTSCRASGADAGESSFITRSLTSPASAFAGTIASRYLSALIATVGHRASTASAAKSNGGSQSTAHASGQLNTSSASGEKA